MTDYRAELATLMAAIYIDVFTEAGNGEPLKRAADRARAIIDLTQPQPEPAGEVGDEELLRMAADAIGYESIKPGQYEQEGSALEAYGSELVTFARAAIALDRSRRAPVQPVAVSERLPGPEDCDEEGRCWWLKERANPEHDLLLPTWHLQRQGPAGSCFFRYTHWLPHTALPLPATPEAES